MSPRLLAVVPLAVGINLALGQFAAATSIPVFLDTTGTILVASLLGIGPALLTGLMSQVVFTVTSGNAMWLAFLPVHLAIAAGAALAASRGAFRSIRRALGAGLLVGLIAATLSWPISYFAFGGVTAGGVTIVTTLLTAAGIPLELAVLGASLSNDLLDKSICFLLVRAILTALPNRIATRFPASQRALGRA